ncbi:MAG: hypothetical protein WBM50_13400 [Acidimicrobiales bacterium]
MRLARKEIKTAGLGSLRSQKSIALDLHHYIGDELDEQKRPRQCVVQCDYDGYITFALKKGFAGSETLAIPKADVEEWGTIRTGDIPTERRPDHANLVAKALMFGPLGAIVGDIQDSVVANRPAVCIRYRVGEAHHAVFFTGGFEKSYRHLHEFLSEALAMGPSGDDV